MSKKTANTEALAVRVLKSGTGLKSNLVYGLL